MYDQLAESYDVLISWKRRLRREKPFFMQLFKQYGVRRILDTASGTGKHAVAFHDWGYHVIGADISPGMNEKARRNSGDRPIEYFEAGFTGLDKTGGMYDAVTCLGNSLPHVLTDEELDASLRCMYDVLLPGGILIIHGNNYDRITGRRERYMPLAHGKRGSAEYLFLRFFDFQDDTLGFNVVTMRKKAGEWEMFTDSSTHRALTYDLLVPKVEAAGFMPPLTYGSFDGQPFEALDSDNLIVVAQKPHTPVSRPPGEPVSAIDRIPIEDNGEPLVELSEAAPELESQEGEPIYGRKTVVEMLRQAQSRLPEGYRLKVKVIYRSLDRQRQLYENFFRQLSEKNPDWPPSRLRRETNKYLAPPDAKHPPGHITGGAVDVTIVDTRGVELDMNSTIKAGVSTMETLPTYSRKITPRAARNRQMLVSAMIGVGFSNYPGEWWHYSYGDSAWALRVGENCAIYDAASPPESFTG